MQYRIAGNVPAQCNIGQNRQGNCPGLCCLTSLKSIHLSHSIPSGEYTISGMDCQTKILGPVTDLLLAISVRRLKEMFHVDGPQGHFLGAMQGTEIAVSLGG